GARLPLRDPLAQQGLDLGGDALGPAVVLVLVGRGPLQDAFDGVLGERLVAGGAVVVVRHGRSLRARSRAPVWARRARYARRRRLSPLASVLTLHRGPPHGGASRAARAAWRKSGGLLALRDVAAVVAVLAAEAGAGGVVLDREAVTLAGLRA